MDMKNRRSSLKRVVAFKENLGCNDLESVSRNKRRISFNSKKLVREFNKEKESKSWDHCYEVSDNISAESLLPNCAEERNHLLKTNISNDTISTFHESSSNKENFLSKKSRNSLKGRIAGESILCTTGDFIDKTQQICYPNIENSTDLTLLEQELQGKRLGHAMIIENSNSKRTTENTDHEESHHTMEMALSPSFTDKVDDANYENSHSSMNMESTLKFKPPKISENMDVLFNDFEYEKNSSTNTPILLSISNLSDNSTLLIESYEKTSLTPVFLEKITSSKKKLTFRQINDNIEQGKIKVFHNQLSSSTKNYKAKKHLFDNEHNSPLHIQNITKIDEDLSFKNPENLKDCSELHCDSSNNTETRTEKLDIQESPECVIRTKNTFIFNGDNDIILNDTTLIEPDTIKKCKTQSFTLDNDKTINCSETEATIINESKEITKCIENIAEKTVCQITDMDQSLLKSPPSNKIFDICNHTNFETPHRSITEFEYLENKTKREQQDFEQIEVPSIQLMRRRTNLNVSNICFNLSGILPINCDEVSESPSNISQKRLRINLTPNSPFRKKRQTILFDHCEISLPSMTRANTYGSMEVFEQNESKKCETIIDCSSKNINITSLDSPIPNEYDKSVHEKSYASDISSMNHISFDNFGKKTEPFLQNQSCSVEYRSSKLEFLPQQKCSLTRIPVLIESAQKKNSIIKKSPNFRDKNNTYQSLDNVEISQCLMEISRTFPQEKSPSTDQIYIKDQGKTIEAQNITINENTTTYLANFQNKYIRLIRDSSSSSLSDEHNIDKTRLSLVETLIDDYDKDEINKTMQFESNNDNNNDLETSNNHVTISSFGLSSIPVMPDIGINRLKKLLMRPTILTVRDYWVRKSLEYSYDITNYKFKKHISFFDRNVNSFSINGLEMNEEKEETIQVLYKNTQEIERKVREPIPLMAENEVDNKKLFSYRAFKMISSEKMDYGMRYQFYHKNIIGFGITITTTQSSTGEPLPVKKVEYLNNGLPKKKWKTIDHLVDFQLKLELPNNGIMEDKSVYDCLEKIDLICIEVHKLVLNLWSLICDVNAKLRRDYNKIIVQKTIRSIAASADLKYSLIKEMEIRIEIKNLRKISYKDVVSPPLHYFEEKIESLPSGIDFIKVFFKKPTEFLKKT